MQEGWSSLHRCSPNRRLPFLERATENKRPTLAYSPSRSFKIPQESRTTAQTAEVGLTPQGITVRDAAGRERKVYGMFAALSYDDGLTWPVKKLITPGGPPRTVRCFGWVENCYLDDNHAEIGGYLAETQTPDGMIHLLSSGLHYRFNLAWLEQPMPAARDVP